MTSQEFREQLQRIEGLVRAVESGGDPAARASAVELVRTLMDLHGAGIERMMEIAFEAGASGAETIDRFGDDELVSSLLVLYGLHPLAFETRVLRALESVRPYLVSNGGDVELLGTADGTVRLRLAGACRGRGSSAMTLRRIVDEALYTAAPDLVTIEVEGVADEPPAPGLVRIGRPSRASA